LYAVISLKKEFIFWPKTPDEIDYIRNGFTHKLDFFLSQILLTGVIGAVDGSHIDIKVVKEQHDSYVDRYLGHLINAMVICTSKKNLTYAFIGFPGSAHDTRVSINVIVNKVIDVLIPGIVPIHFCEKY
jgi:hypothetical protein